MVRVLADAAGVNAATSDGWTALMKAVSRSDVEMVAVLLEKGADGIARSRNHSALSLASRGQKAEIVQLLIGAGASSDRGAIYANSQVLRSTELQGRSVCKVRSCGNQLRQLDVPLCLKPLAAATTAR